MVILINKKGEKGKRKRKTGHTISKVAVKALGGPLW